ncbi:MAG: hypothetical protein KGH64_03285 [Candidatus Micrarchaeota archaeon]|nr:hypothetical protein [Candidatus Micrarchaeota archaeon]MDE1834336.1 hypothetical protein [Candidatus Micrarchaeota archaeon]MDE1859812.1 hypothetical protein [Candidatus Micrarchaeota archaeon]
MPKISIVKPAAKFITSTRMHQILFEIRTGWNSYSFLFYISGISVITWAFLGLASSLAALVITFAIFYYLGKIHNEALSMEAEQNKAVK